MSKSLDDVLRAAFMAGVRYADDTDTPVIAEEFWREWPDAERFYRRWRTRMANEPPVGVGTGDAVGHEREEDEDGPQTLPRSTTSFCPECGPGYRFGQEGCNHGKKRKSCSCLPGVFASPLCPVHGKTVRGGA